MPITSTVAFLQLPSSSLLTQAIFLLGSPSSLTLNKKEVFNSLLRMGRSFLVTMESKFKIKEKSLIQCSTRALEE